MDVKSFIYFFSVPNHLKKITSKKKTQVFVASLPNVGVFTGAKRPLIKIVDLTCGIGMDP